jgi:hypothetical protein
MAKRKVDEEVQSTTESADDFPGDTGAEGDGSDALGDLDFNVNDEYKPPPLIPKGSYHGVATKITFEPAKYCIVWDFCLHDNGGAMNDGETPIDGAHVYARNWLPRPGDESEMTKSGKSNKRQSKINMLKDFQEALQIDMSTPFQIATALSEQAWIGVEADVAVDVEEWEGRFRNVVNRVVKSTMY